jgi:ABC-type transport system involved in cytochrome bd biosynthesis fused ATPase/permease subunit
MIDDIQLNDIAEQSYFEKVSYLNNNPQFFAGTIQEILLFLKNSTNLEIISFFLIKMRKLICKANWRLSKVLPFQAGSCND